MARKPNATQEFRTPHTKKDSRIQTTVAYRTARIARARQKREIEMQKREKLIFALIVVTILVMIILAILIFKKVLGTEPPVDDTSNDTNYADVTDDTGEPEDTGKVDDPVVVTPGVTVPVAKTEVKKGSLILVDSEHPYVQDSVTLNNIKNSRTPFDKNTRAPLDTVPNGKKVFSYYTKDDTPELEEKALTALNALCDAFYTTTGNNDLYIRNAYDTSSDKHATGLAVDLGIYTLEYVLYSLDDAKFADIYDWFFDNYHKYGFIIDSDADHSFCFRYVGVPHAYYMHEHDIGLKEYLALVQREPLAFTTNSGDKYEVSYVHATGDVVNITVPSAESEYEISGDNMEGIIVTVKVK